MSRPGEYANVRPVPAARPNIPLQSPWRVPATASSTHASASDSNGSASATPSLASLKPSDLGHTDASRLPALPKLGQTNQKPGHGQQPTFAQIVQQAQQQTPKLAQQTHLNHKTLPQLSSLPKLSSQSPAPAAARPMNANSADSGAHILGSMQMMPKVTASHGMSGLQTVLPGTAGSGVQTSAGPNGNTSNTSNDVSANHSNSNTKSASTSTAQTPVNAHAELPALQSLSLNSSANHAHVTPDFGGLKPLLKALDAKEGIEKQQTLLGSDLSAQQPMLASRIRLSSVLASPWEEQAKQTVVPDYTLPACYSIATVVPQQQKLQNFDEGALFYIFYTMPRDAMQEAAAVELTNRSWRYHKELKMWLTKDPMSEPVQTGSQEESGMYIFFDPTSWKKIKREYVLFYPDIAEFVSWKPFNAI